jgi:uncharacterized protein (TIGR02246 family)
MSQRNVEIVRELFDTWPRGDLEGFLAMLTPDVEWRFADNFVYGQVNPLIGRDALRAGSLARLRTDWEEFNALPTEFLDAGDEVVVLGHYVGTYKATRKKLRAQFTHFYKVKDGKVARWRQSVDTKAFADAMSSQTTVTDVPGAADEEVIRSFHQAMNDAWNRASATDFAAPFTDTADFIAFEGTHLAGRAQIVAFHQPLFDTILQGSRLESEVQFVRFIGSELAVMHGFVRVTLPGQRQSTPSRNSMQLYVAIKRDGKWAVEAMLNARRLTLEQQAFADELAALSAKGRAEVGELVASLSRHKMT